MTDETLNPLEMYKQLKQDYLDVFSGEKGERVLKDLQKKCFINRTTFDKDALMIAFREGERSVVLHIQTMQSLDLDKLEKQLKTQQKEGE